MNQEINFISFDFLNLYMSQLVCHICFTHLSVCVHLGIHLWRQHSENIMCSYIRLVKMFFVLVSTYSLV